MVLSDRILLLGAFFSCGLYPLFDSYFHRRNYDDRRRAMAFRCGVWHVLLVILFWSLVVVWQIVVLLAYLLLNAQPGGGGLWARASSAVGMTLVFIYLLINSTVLVVNIVRAKRGGPYWWPGLTEGVMRIVGLESELRSEAR